MSILANVALVALVVWLAQCVRIAHRSALAIPARANSNAVSSASNIPVSTEGDNPGVQQPFRWSQLESTDYRAYVDNLRGIGCPEQTIRDIISADLDAGWYAERRRKLRQKLDSDPSTAAATELGQLSREEASVLATLLGTAPDGSPEAVANSPDPARSNRLAEGPARMPLAFQSVDPSALKFTGEEAEFIDSVRQTFREELGGSNPDTTDPAYRRRWEIAQRDADQSLRGMLGRRRYLEYQEQAENQAAPQ